jgi:hypothetical protein
MKPVKDISGLRVSRESLNAGKFTSAITESGERTVVIIYTTYHKWYVLSVITLFAEHNLCLTD